MLVQTGNLELVSMNTLPAQPITVEQLETGYYRHGLSLQVQGSYLDTLRYLQALETLQWKFLWGAVRLEVIEHPTSSVTITVFTLGRRPGSIGV
jgi:MSHA biogenesis protein MshJ